MKPIKRTKLVQMRPPKTKPNVVHFASTAKVLFRPIKQGTPDDPSKILFYALGIMQINPLEIAGKTKEEAQALFDTKTIDDMNIHMVFHSPEHIEKFIEMLITMRNEMIEANRSLIIAPNSQPIVMKG